MYWSVFLNSLLGRNTGTKALAARLTALVDTELCELSGISAVPDLRTTQPTVGRRVVSNYSFCE